MVIDNVLWGGDVADPDNQTAETNAIRAFNRMVHEDDKVDMCMLPVGGRHHPDQETLIHATS